MSGDQGEELVAMKLIISRVITDDGSMTVRIETPNEFSRVEALGVLEVAKSQILRDIDWRREP